MPSDDHRAPQPLWTKDHPPKPTVEGVFRPLKVVFLLVLAGLGIEALGIPVAHIWHNRDAAMAIWGVGCAVMAVGAVHGFWVCVVDVVRWCQQNRWLNSPPPADTLDDEGFDR